MRGVAIAWVYGWVCSLMVWRLWVRNENCADMVDHIDTLSVEGRVGKPSWKSVGLHFLCSHHLFQVMTREEAGR